MYKPKMSKFLTPNFDYMIEILNVIRIGHKRIQYRLISSESENDWKDMAFNDLPNFNDFEYKIKPEIKKFRIALFDDKIHDIYVRAIRDENDANQIEQNDPAFIKWLTDWIEYYGNKN